MTYEGKARQQGARRHVSAVHWDSTGETCTCCFTRWRSKPHL